MSALANFVIARPRRVLCAWLVLVAALGVAGLKVEGELHRTSPVVPGTASAQEEQAAARRFGASSTLVVLLEGAHARVEQQGPAIAEALGRVAHVSAYSPWSLGAPATLRPRPDRAVVLLRVDRTFNTTSKTVVPAIGAVLARTVHAPLRAHLTGYADIAAGIEHGSLDALKQAELIAAPALIVILLLVFRSAVAAAVPLLLGFSSIVAGRGVLALINATVQPLDSVALSLASMFGLALGVDYSLLMVSRFREELTEGRDPRTAALHAARTAGHTALVAGLALAATMVAGYAIAPGKVLASGSIGGLVGVLVSVLGATTAMPALLRLMGPRVDRWTIGRRSGVTGSRSGAIAWRIVGRPLLAAGVVIVLLLALSSQAPRLHIKPPDKESLVPDSRVRVDEETIVRALGSGWTAPYEILIEAAPYKRRPVLNLARVAAWQDRVARDRAVAGAFGPAQLISSQPGTAQSDAQLLQFIAGSPPPVREVADFAINLDRGSNAIRISLIERTRTGAGHPGDPLRARLERDATELARETHMRVSVGGPAANLQDFTAASIDRLPLLIVVLAIVTFVILVLVLRSLLVPAIAVALNVLTVTAALGVLVLCFQGSAPLGGAGSLDAVVTPAIISVSFGLAIDYEVFLLARIRERYLLTGDVDGAIEYALGRTASIITGAALIMTAVFVAFSTAKIMNLREFGVGLVAAVLLDATVVRLVLLPAALRLLGPRAWWMPALGRGVRSTTRSAPGAVR